MFLGLLFALLNGGHHCEGVYRELSVSSFVVVDEWRYVGDWRTSALFRHLHNGLIFEEQDVLMSLKILLDVADGSWTFIQVDLSNYAL